MSTLPKQTKTFFPNLDGLRTLACLAVYGFHAFLLAIPGNAPTYRVFSVFGSGNMGVNFFFVLSGFLITYLLLEEEQQNQRINLLAFYRRRVLRIWPLFYACLAYGFGVLPLLLHLLHMPHHETARLGLHMAFLGNLDTIWQGNVEPASHGLVVLWSVAVEEQFYLVWPILLMLVFRQWRPGAFLLIIVGSLWFRYLHITNGDLIYHHSLSVMSDMGMGGAAAWVCFRFPAFRQHIAGWSRWTIAGLYLAALGLIVAQKMAPGTPLTLTVQRMIRSFLFVLIILEQNYAVNSWFKIKNNRWLTYWGTYTYGLYCLHPIVLEWLYFASAYLHLAPTAFSNMVRGIIGLPLSAGLAWLSYTYWERPFLLLKNRRQPAVVVAEPGAALPTPAPEINQPAAALPSLQASTSEPVARVRAEK